MKLPKLRLPTLRWTWFPWVLAVVLLGTTLTNWWLLRSERREDTRITDVRETATDFLLALTNFSAQTIDQDVVKIRSFAVGDFAQQVTETFSAARIAQIKKARLKSTSEVRSVFVESVSGESATAFGVVDETVSNATSNGPRTDVLRVELGLIDTPAGWKIDRVTILQSPGSVVPGGTA